MSQAAFIFVISLVNTAILLASASVPRCISCPCGSSNQNYTQCIDESLDKDFSCARWSNCQTCKANTTFCVRCPPDRIGPSCSINTCAFLTRPEKASITCGQGGNERFCTSRCLPGYHFEGEENVNEMTLRCLGGRWSPLLIFPQCKSGGYCGVQMTNEGCYNCTTDMEGTHCDITCNGTQQGRFHCYPGRQWKPALPFCAAPKGELIRRKRQDNGNFLNYPSQSGSCPFLEQPDSGSIRCSQRNNERSCTFRCLPGYHFEGQENRNEMTLQCHQGVWSPLAYFPQCISGGHCEVEVTGSGGGFYNCTTDMNGTHCDITCSGRPQGIFHCYLGRQWTPRLPFCATSKVPERPSCRCQNGGVCDDSGRCTCPNGRTGTYCESVDRQRATCPDPGIPRDGSRFNTDGSDASYPRVFGERESVIFSCNGDNFALQGKSFLTCLADGTWSANLPRCVRSTPVGRPSETSCRRPGVDVNGVIEDHPLLDPQRRGQTFPPDTELRFRCNEGYSPEGPTILICQRSGEWSTAPPTCRRIPTTTSTTERPLSEEVCKHPGVDVNGRIEGDPLDPRERRQMFPRDSGLTFSCNDGFELQGPTIIYCLSNGEWTSVPPSCRRIRPDDEPSDLTQLCPVPRVNPNVEVEEFIFLDPRKLQGFETGQELTFKCREGYVLEGESVIRCLFTGRWTSESPTCNPKERNPGCPVPEIDPNGEVEEFLLDPRKLTQSFERGTDLTFRCKEGYILQGWSTITCGSNGRWSSPSPLCNVEDCGHSLVSHTVRITNGSKTLAGEWPWTVAIAVLRDDFPHIICGGALLDRRTVLTAAHCLTNAESYTLYFGKYNRSVRHDDKEVKVGNSYDLISHPEFDIETFDNDIALIKFWPDVSYSKRIQPICLPTRNSSDKYLVSGSKGYVTGWGLNENQLLSDQLMLANLPIQSYNVCMAAYNKRSLPLNLDGGKYCAGHQQGITSACKGDSGSPMVFYDIKSSSHILEGLVSFGITGECSDPEKYTVFVKVSHFMNWIFQNWRR